MGEDWNKGFIRGYLNLLQFTKLLNKKLPNVRGFQLYDAHENRFVPYPQNPSRIGSICEALRDLLSVLVFLVSFIAAFQNLAQFAKTNEPKYILRFVIHTVIYGISLETLAAILTWYRDLGTCAAAETAMLHLWLRTRRDKLHAPVDERRKATKKKTALRTIATDEILVYIGASVFYFGAPFVLPTFMVSLKEEPFGLILGLLPIVRDWSRVIRKAISFSLAVPYCVFGQQMLFMFLMDSFNWLLIVIKLMPSLLPEKCGTKINMSENSGNIFMIPRRESYREFAGGDDPLRFSTDIGSDHEWSNGIALLYVFRVFTCIYYYMVWNISFANGLCTGHVSKVQRGVELENVWKDGKDGVKSMSGSWTSSRPLFRL
ncbi:unnamed protein product [Orchesella dallaii]|uniref:Transmembrane protein n=1 Tax=Orchesella dallaii TaxID=48710 RepID=A0ABP1RQR5_9HEXA